MISAVLAFRGGKLNHEMLDLFGLEPTIATSSAFIQQRAQILPEAFECLFHYFTDRMDINELYHGLRLLAVDGSDLQIAANPNDPDSYFPGINGQKPYNLMHINAMYDLLQCIYLDAVIQKRKNWDESGALTDLVVRSDIENALLLADRGMNPTTTWLIFRKRAGFSSYASTIIRRELHQDWSCRTQMNMISRST